MWEWLQIVLLNSYFAVKIRGQEAWIHHLHVKWLSKGHSVMNNNACWKNPTWSLF